MVIYVKFEILDWHYLLLVILNMAINVQNTAKLTNHISLMSECCAKTTKVGIKG